MSEELKALKKQLLKDDRNGYDVLSAADLEKMEAYCTVYKAFLDAGKTERLSARAAIALAEKHGFVEYKRGMSLSAGDKVYSCNRGKGLVLAVVGRRSLAEGAQITAAHIDSPRLDLKPTPPVRGQRAGLLQDPLLRRRPQVPVGHHSSGAAGRRGPA